MVPQLICLGLIAGRGWLAADPARLAGRGWLAADPAAREIHDPRAQYYIAPFHPLTMVKPAGSWVRVPTARVLYNIISANGNPREQGGFRRDHTGSDPSSCSDWRSGLSAAVGNPEIFWGFLSWIPVGKMAPFSTT